MSPRHLLISPGMARRFLRHLSISYGMPRPPYDILNLSWSGSMPLRRLLFSRGVACISPSRDVTWCPCSISRSLAVRTLLGATPNKMNFDKLHHWLRPLDHVFCYNRSGTPSMAFPESVILPSTMSPAMTTRARYWPTPELVMPPLATSLTTTTRACHWWAPSSRSCHKWPCLCLWLLEHTVDGLSWVSHTTNGNALDYDYSNTLPSVLT